MTVRRTVSLGIATFALALGGAAVAGPATAAPLFTGGLVNVNVSDIDVDALNDSLDDNDVRVLNDVLNDNQVSVGVVAQVVAQLCDTNVGGVLGTLRDTGTAACDTAAGPVSFTTVR